MHLPFLPHFRHSKFNGWITVTKGGVVWVEGIKQTSEHYDELWADAFVHANMLKDRAVTEVLMLGLAGGGALKAIYEAYPGCHITAVEIDPVMVEIAQELQLQKPHPFPRVLVGDAKEVLEKLKEKFDVIAVDIFKGITPSPHIDSDEFWELVARHLNPGGVAVLNVAIATTRLYTAEKHFKQFGAWQYDTNTFCALANS